MTKSQPTKNFFSKYYASQVKAQCNTCSVATMVINREHHLYKTRNERGIFLKSFIKRICAKKPKDSTPQTVTKTCVCEPATVCKDCKILIVCKGSTFSQNVMDYSINLATKTRSSLVALSLDERGSNFTQFREEAVKNFTRFSSMIAEAGLQCEHVVKQGAENSVVAKLYDSDEAFRYVLDDIGGTRSKKQIIPVYTRATMRTR